MLTRTFRRSPARAGAGIRLRIRRGRLAVAGMILLGLLLRVPALLLPGSGDTLIWKLWAYVAATRGVTQAYPLQGHQPWTPLTLAALRHVRSGALRPRANSYIRQVPPGGVGPPGVSGPTDYPPGTILILWVVGKVYEDLFAPTLADSPLFIVLIKLPLVLADAAAAALIAWAVRRRAGPRRPALPWVAAGLYWCNPTVIVGGSVLGYLDALYSLPLLVAVVALSRGRYAAGWGAWGVAGIIKLQALFALPALGLLSLRRGLARLPGYLAAAGAVGAAMCVPFLLGNTFVGLLAGLATDIPGLGPRTGQDYLSGNQANLWWVWSYFWEWHAEGRGPGVQVAIVPPSKILQLGVANLNLWGEGLYIAFLVGTTVVWWLGRRRAGRPPLPDVADLFLVALQFYGATMLLPESHQNHLLGVLPLLALLVGLAAARGPARPARQLAWLYGALSLVVGLNLVLFYGFGKQAWFPVPRMWFGLDSTVPLAAANVLLFIITLAIWGVGQLARRRVAPVP